MRIKKKFTSGNAKNFITRTQAVKRLQVSLADFRRLCIFKGIYPREPRNKKKANKGSTAPVTFYYAKDIQYLQHEPVLAKFREHKTFAKKLTKALGKGEVNDAKRLESNRPKYKLDHVIKERYPTFLDAVRDIDDCLNMLFLFSNMPATDKVSARVTKEANELCNQWLAYVAKERALRKVFVSIKGVYYSATVKGQEVTWLVPFKFPQNIPSDIDFRIMLTFLEFYSTLLHFVLFKLYTDSNLLYPPNVDFQKLKGVGGLSAYVLEVKDSQNTLLPSAKADSASEVTTKLTKSEIAKALKADQDDEGVEENEDTQENTENVEDVQLDTFEDNNKNAGDLLEQPSQFGSPAATLFSKFVFYVGREVPIDIVEFIIVSCGGKVISEAALDEVLLNSNSSINEFDFSNVTHQISDRPKIANKVQGRTYIQPQWIFDCVNKNQLLNVSDYAPGEVLPPHLSPWGDAGGYDPEAYTAPAEGEEEESEEEVEVDDEDIDQDEEEEEEDEDVKAQKELELEAKGVKYSEVETKSEKKKSNKRSAEEEEKDLKMIMMSNKQKKLYKKMQYGINKDEQRTEELQKKRRKIEKTKSKLQKLDKK
ncbi:unnamed protein product [Kuraishia capsulata CBS 1993]|uniref:Pescadillo homolog n=1 Tax=Kuraishia capsulata CBS 1993 TaxID=1382522 RepID=W6MK28_9ASCO|nr:uncharacterized protein KUCA_T00000899001 [Kuraishia capsulata CBS 1993]CDK24932.1 unnamed protein product [Kuraishia capsulata CBS 1993]